MSYDKAFLDAKSPQVDPQRPALDAPSPQAAPPFAPTGSALGMGSPLAAARMGHPGAVRAMHAAGPRTAGLARRSAPASPDAADPTTAEAAEAPTFTQPQGADPVTAAPSPAPEDPQSAPPLDYQPINAAIAARFETYTGEQVSDVLIAENPALVAQGKRGVAIEGRCVEVIPGLLNDLALCAHELTHIVQQRGPSKKTCAYIQPIATDAESEAISVASSIVLGQRVAISVSSSAERLFDGYGDVPGLSKPADLSGLKGTDLTTSGQCTAPPENDPTCKPLPKSKDEYIIAPSAPSSPFHGKEVAYDPDSGETFEICARGSQVLGRSQEDVEKKNAGPDCGEGRRHDIARGCVDNAYQPPQMYATPNPHPGPLGFGPDWGGSAKANQANKTAAHLAACSAPGSGEVCDAVEMYSDASKLWNGHPDASWFDLGLSSLAMALPFASAVTLKNLANRRRVVGDFEHVVSGPGNTPSLSPSKVVTNTTPSSSTTPSPLQSANLNSPSPSKTPSSTSPQSTNPVSTSLSSTPSTTSSSLPSTNSVSLSPSTTSIHKGTYSNLDDGELQKSLRHYNQLKIEHEKKLKAWMENPLGFDEKGMKLDNKGTYKDAPDHLKPKILQGRANSLRKQIEKHEGELVKIKEEIKKEKSNEDYNR